MREGRPSLRQDEARRKKTPSHGVGIQTVWLVLGEGWLVLSVERWFARILYVEEK